MTSMLGMQYLADLLYLLAGIGYLPIALYNAFVRGKNRSGWRHRFGFVPERRSDVQRIMIHAVSLGEVNATPRLVEMMRERHPSLDVLISTTTDTGYRRAVQFYGEENVIRSPLDFSFVVSRVLNRSRPSLLVLVEQELWFNLIHACHARGIPVAVVNGRMTERSGGRYAMIAPLLRGVFARLSWVGAQDEAMAQRFIRLGANADQVRTIPSLKWDSAQVSDDVPGREDMARALGLMESQAPVWVCGSTGVGEDALILDAYRQWEAGWGPRPRLILVPRRPETFDQVARSITEAGYALIRRSEAASPEQATTHRGGEEPVILGDTMGELRAFYALADVVFVGRSLVPAGGSDPMEVAGLGRSMIVGPHTSNFREPIRILKEAGVVEVVDDATTLIQAVRRQCDDLQKVREAGVTARDAVLAQQGGTRLTADALSAFLSHPTA
ncbi:MAG: 3-deoxy-D-manno-octulosonic acid transferase [Phycisphaerae bacterium]